MRYDPGGLRGSHGPRARLVIGHWHEGFASSSYYDANDKGSRSDPDLTEWIDYFCARLGEAAGQMRRELEDSFRARHPELLDDPLVELPDNLRRFLAGLDPLDQRFAAADVSTRFSVSDRSARAWLKRWREAGFVEPARAGAKRVRAYRMTDSWLARLGDSGNPSDP